MKISNIGNGIFKITGEISVFNINDFYEGIKNLTEKHNKIYLDLSGIYSIDTAGIQILLSFKKTGIKNKKDFRIMKPSEEVREQLITLGVI